MQKHVGAGYVELASSFSLPAGAKEITDDFSIRYFSRLYCLVPDWRLDYYPSREETSNAGARAWESLIGIVDCGLFYPNFIDENAFDLWPIVTLRSICDPGGKMHEGHVRYQKMKMSGADLKNGLTTIYMEKYLELRGLSSSVEYNPVMWRDY